MQPDSPLMHAARCPYSLPGAAAEHSPQGPAQKKVWFNLMDDLGEVLQLPPNMASFLGQQEDATDEQTMLNAHLPP